ncbi:MAG TPA: Gfo/Idh/MocA family oxidoreductase [Candidatus Binataceae bacterium]|nr:Gfo/Idh/MocA family oxidoreductase [Candidatus Binataceae bacterium]
MAKLNAAVIGAGRLGTLHAAKYEALEQVRLRYIVDIDLPRAQALAASSGAEALTDYRLLQGRVDLASVATPTLSHAEIAGFLLNSQINVLLEKPMTATLEQARTLAALAARSSALLQVGHLERFNPAVLRLPPILAHPRYIECHRLAPFTERGTDVDVVFDLMVHDLDLILSLAQAPVVAVEALGVAVLTDRIDVANARLRFGDGMIANVNTSRVAPRRERKIRFFQPDAYISLDYEARKLQIYRKQAPAPGAAYPTISAELIDLHAGDPLAEEIGEFVTAVIERSAPRVGAQEGLRVIELCQWVSSQIAAGQP